MVQEYYVSRLRAASAKRNESRAAIRTKAQVMALREEVRRKLQDTFAPFPKRTPLNLRITGTLERREYRIEKLIYESRPGYLVTANLYVPKHACRPMPGVLGVCGHDAVGKAAPNSQTFMQFLARQGYIGLILDPVSQGERRQYLGCRGKHVPTHCVQEHDMAGGQLGLTGEFFGTWRLWDAIRGLDVLLARPEVDPARVGVTGNSGGGTLSAYLTAFDDRFCMAAPSCFVTTYLADLENELYADAEQIPPGIVAAGLDMADFFVAQIPRPTLLLGQKYDGFDPRALTQTYEELKRLYSIVGAEQNIRLFIGPRQHGYFAENREAMYAFFHKHAGITARLREGRTIKLEQPEALNATPKGEVHYLGMRKILDFTRERADMLEERRASITDCALKRRIVKRLALPERAGTPHYRIMRRISLDRGSTRSRRTVETEPGIQTILHIVHEQGPFFHLTDLKKTTLHVPDMSAVEVFSRAPAGGPPFLVVEPRGVGETRSRAACDPDDFLKPGGTDYLYTSNGLLLNESYCGRRTHDLLVVLDLLQDKGYESVHLVGHGIGALSATFAACLHGLVTRVTLHNALISYHELTQVPVHAWPHAALVHGILQDFDLPDCYRLLKAKQLEFVAPWNHLRRPWRKDPLRSHMAALGLSALNIR